MAHAEGISAPTTVLSAGHSANSYPSCREMLPYASKVTGTTTMMMVFVTLKSWYVSLQITPAPVKQEAKST